MAPKVQLPDSLNTQPLSGLRAVACLGVLIGHCMFWVAGSAQDKLQLYEQMDAFMWMTGLMKMLELFMDTFLVLTGFLAAKSLLPGLANASNYRSYILRSSKAQYYSTPCEDMSLASQPSADDHNSAFLHFALLVQNLCRRYYKTRIARVAPNLYSMLGITYVMVLPAISHGLISADARSVQPPDRRILLMQISSFNRLCDITFDKQIRMRFEPISC
jgi:hypothetical protein